MPRVVSLIASATEIICSLGMRDHLVGRSHECDYPPGIETLPVCTAPRFPVDGTSREIDQHVRNTLRQAASVYEIDVPTLRQLKPDVIVTQAQCEVCAVSLRDVEAALGDWLGRRPQVVSLNPVDLEDVWQDIRRVAQVLDRAAQGEHLVEHLEQRMQEAVGKIPDGTPVQRVACLEWLDPLMAAGNWVPTLVDLAGGEALFGQSGQHAPYFDWQELLAADPDVIICMPCGFDLDRTRREACSLVDREGWSTLRAVQQRRVAVTDGNQFFNRPGPRLVESLEILIEILHPRGEQFGHRGTGWDYMQ